MQQRWREDEEEALMAETLTARRWRQPRRWKGGEGGGDSGGEYGDSGSKKTAETVVMR